MKNFWDKAVKAWCHFFFQTTSPATLGIYRIGLGLVLLITNIGRYPIRDIFWGENAIVSYHTMDKLFPPGPSWLYFRWLPETEPALGYVFIVLFIINVLFILGIFSRIMNFGLYVGVALFSARNLAADNAGDTVILLNLFFLMFTDSGAAYSLERLWKVKRGLAPKKPQPVSMWPIRMLQLQLCWIYINTVYLKSYGPSWRDGTALYYALNYLELRRFNVRPLFYNLFIVKVATYGVLLAEISSGTLVWIKKLRYPILVMSVLMHIGINIALQFPAFQYAMIASWLIFVDPKDTERFINFISTKWTNLIHPPSRARKLLKFLRSA